MGSGLELETNIILWRLCDQCKGLVFVDAGIEAPLMHVRLWN